MIVATTAETAEAAREAGAGEPADVLASLRRTTSRWVRQGSQPRTTSGLKKLDALLRGGWPVGKVGEIVGPVSSGRTAVAVATTAAATGRGEVVAWIDASDAFDPASALRCGVDLGGVLWVRAERVEQAVRAAEIVLETGGIAVVVLDLAGPSGSGTRGEWADPPRGAEDPRPFRWENEGPDGTNQPDGRTRRSPVFGGGRERRNTLGLRLSRAVERAGSVALVLAERRWVGAQAGARVTLRRGTALWGGERDAPRWLAGLATRADVDRSGAPNAGDTDLRFTWERGTPVVELSQPAASDLPASNPDSRASDPGPRSPVPGCLGA